MKINLYIDLDGVILRRTGNTEFGGRVEFDVAPNAIDFLTWSVKNYQCYWLTSRSHDGTYDEIERAFRFAIPTNNIEQATKELIRAITPTKWGADKISGIDLSKEFYWVDDNPDPVSVAALKAKNLSDRLIFASTDKNPADLDRVRKHLIKFTEPTSCIRTKGVFAVSANGTI